MPISPHPPLTFYPAYCFPLSTIHNTWAKLTAADVHALRERSGFEGQNLYFYLNHPIKWVRLVGVIVAFDVFPTRWIMVLDDSSGSTIEVTCGRSAARVSMEKGVATKGATSLGGVTRAGEDLQIGTTATGRNIDLKGVDVGAVVKVKGGIGTFRGEKQLVLERLSLIHSTSEEAAAWTELSEFRKDILSKPWVLSEKEQARAKRKAEGSDKIRERKAREERKRKKEQQEGKVQCSTKERHRGDRGGEGETIKRKGNGNGHRPDGERPRRLDREPKVGTSGLAVARVEVTRPAVSGTFDALGL